MKDRSKAPLAAFGFGSRKEFRKQLAATKHVVDESDMDEGLPLPKPKRNSFAKGRGTTDKWVLNVDGDIPDMLHCIEGKLDALNAWETDFFVSIKEQSEKKGGLTTKQYEILSRIFEEKC